MEEIQTFRTEFRDCCQVLTAEQRFNKNDSQVMNNLDDCIRSAEVVAEVASTTISIRSTGSHSREQGGDRTALWIENHAFAEADNNGLSSVTSDIAAQPITPGPSTVASTGGRVQSVVTPSMATAALHDRTGPASSFANVFNDVNYFDDFRRELICVWLKEGKAQFDLGNYEDAAEYMRTVITRARETQYEGKTEAIEESIKLLAKCYCHWDAFESAQATLLNSELINDNTRTALQAAEMDHSLAEVYLLKEDYDSAEKSCRDAITKKSRILSRTHESFYSSICLLVQILERKGSRNIAVAYKALLPPEMGTSHYR